MRRLLLLVAFLLGCPAPARYAVVQPGLPCERANRVAYRTMLALGYTVTDLVPASPAHTGSIAATKAGPEGEPGKVRVDIRCDAAGAVLQPVEGSVVSNYDFSRAFGYSFKTLVQGPDEEEPRAGRGLEVLVHVLLPHEALLDLGGEPTVGGAVAVRITIRNHTARAVQIDPAEVELVAADGESAAPLSGPSFDAALAANAGGERVRRERLARTRVRANETVVGYAVYPGAAYREARIAIEDVETGETEGFVAPVQ